MQNKKLLSSPFELSKDGSHYDLSHAFLPREAPLGTLPKECAVWEEVACALPKLLMTNQYRKIVGALPSFPIEALRTAEEYERAMVVLSYIGQAYVWASGEKPIAKLPKHLATAWYAAATQLGRPPILSYASYALYNWKRIDLHKPIELGNIALIQNFLGGLDEEWFILIHVDIEAKATEGLMAIHPIQEAVTKKDISALTPLMKKMVGSLEAMNATMDCMPEFCDPYIYYNRVRPYIHGWKDNPALPEGMLYEGVTAYENKPMKFKGETGAQSTIIPSFDALLKIDHENNPLRTHLDEMRLYMPREHVAFLHSIEKGPSVRTCIQKHANNNGELRDLYNECISLIGRFRGTHLRFAADYIQKQNQTSLANATQVGTGGTPFMAYLKKHEEETQKHFL